MRHREGNTTGVIIDLKDIQYYYLTCDTNSSRATHIRDIFSNYKLKEINPILGINKFKSGAIGYSRMIDMGLRNQKHDSKFQPFALIEDDVSILNDINTISVPDNTDILYIGNSIWGVNDTNSLVGKPIVYYKNYNDELVKVYNMLSTHGIVVVSSNGANMLQKGLLESFYKNKPYDVYIAVQQPYYNCYALRKPFVYQDRKHGGQKGSTKHSFSYDNNAIEKQNIFTDTDSITVINPSSIY